MRRAALLLAVAAMAACCLADYAFDPHTRTIGADPGGCPPCVPDGWVAWMGGWFWLALALGIAAWTVVIVQAAIDRGMQINQFAADRGVTFVYTLRLDRAELAGARQVEIRFFTNSTACPIAEGQAMQGDAADPGRPAFSMLPVALNRGEGRVATHVKDQ